jgi:superfamily II DNA or RNA helicase
VTQVKHGKALCSLLERNGLKAEFAWGEKETSMRHAALKRLERGETEVLVANGIFQLGIDLPSLKSVVIATGGKSVIAALQRIGRGMRADAKTNKTTFEVFDIYDKGCGCTEDKDRDDPPHVGCRILEKHSKERLKAYRSEGFIPQIIKDKGENMNLPGV